MSSSKNTESESLPSLRRIANALRKKSETDTQYLGHPEAFESKRWKKWEEGKCMLVKDDEPNDPAIFWLVGQISREGFWLSADGGWNRKLDKPFTSHHATAFLVRPPDESLGQLFDSALSSAPRVEALGKEPEVSIGNHLVRSPRQIDSTCFKLKHRILVVPEVDDDAESQSANTSQRTVYERSEENGIVEATWREMDKYWTLAKLPCRVHARDELDILLRSNPFGYKWKLLEAYGQNGLPMAPNEYETLRGATVLCYMTICRWEIKDKYSFSPHIAQLRILSPVETVPVGATLSIPKKRLGTSTMKEL